MANPIGKIYKQIYSGESRKPPEAKSISKSIARNPRKPRWPNPRANLMRLVFQHLTSRVSKQVNTVFHPRIPDRQFLCKHVLRNSRKPCKAILRSHTKLSKPHESNLHVSLQHRILSNLVGQVYKRFHSMKS